MNSQRAEAAETTANSILSRMEIEAIIVQILEPSTFEEIGSPRWIQKSKLIEKLAPTAAFELKALKEKPSTEQIIRQTFIKHDKKLTVLIREIILLEIWRTKLLPDLINKSNPILTRTKKPCQFTIFLVLCHEAMCVNLLEILMNHAEILELVDRDENSSVNLVEYCLNSIANLIKSEPFEPHTILNVQALAEFKFNLLPHVILFRTGLNSLKCISHLISNLDKINSSAVITKLFTSSDAPMLLAELLLKTPWRRINKYGDEEEYSRMSNYKQSPTWSKIVLPEDKQIMEPIQLHAWTILNSSFQDPEIISTYKINEKRRAQLVKLHELLGETRIEDHPTLSHLKSWLEANTKSTNGSSIDHEIGAIDAVKFKNHRSELLIDFQSKRESILRTHSTFSTFEISTNKERHIKLAELNKLVSKCAHCGLGSPHSQCSRCHFELYCQNACQRAHWRHHKVLCEMIIADTTKKLKNKSFI